MEAGVKRNELEKTNVETERGKCKLFTPYEICLFVGDQPTLAAVGSIVGRTEKPTIVNILPYLKMLSFFGPPLEVPKCQNPNLKSLKQ